MAKNNKRKFDSGVFIIAGKRLIAFLIDWYVSTFLAEIPVLFFQSLNAKDLVLQNTLEGLSMNQAIISVILALLIYIYYFCLFPLSIHKKFEHGQTLGRKLMKINVVKNNDEQANLVNLLLRDFVGVFMLQGMLTSVNVYIMSLIQMFFTVSIIPYFYSVYYVCMFASIILLFVTKNNRNLQDLISYTKVINMD